MPEDRIAITSSKSDVDPCRHGRVLTAKKVRTDGFQLYIVEDNIPVHTEWYNCIPRYILCIYHEMNKKYRQFSLDFLTQFS